jgi:uncharacterized protein YjbJ (UPF0337 family)
MQQILLQQRGNQMTLNENIVLGKWTEIKDEIQKAWGKLTEDELEKTKGDMKAIKGLLQQKYGELEATYDKKVKDIFEKFKAVKDDAIHTTKTTIA